MLDELLDPAVDDRGPVLVLDTLVGDVEAGERIVAGRQGAAALVRLQYDLHAARVRQERQLDLVDLLRVRGRRDELDLLVERQSLAGAADAPVLEVGRLETEPEPAQGFEHGLLHRQWRDDQLVEIALVLRTRHRQLGAHAEDDAQALPVQLGGRRLPRQGHAERHAALLALGEAEAAADGEAVEGDDVLALTALVLGLDPGHQLQGDVLDLEVRFSAHELNLAGERAAGPDGSRVEDRVDGGAAHAERAEQSFEHHGGVHSFTCVC